ncbi:MAG: iron hydrogenase small subunit, partial [Candidatus Fimimonas sp.]
SQFTKLEFAEVRGLQGVKEASYSVNGTTLKIAVVNGLNNAKALCEKIRNGEANYHFVEVMTCHGGCVMGGGQPIRATIIKHKNEIAQARASVLYSADKAMYNRRSHKNNSVNEIYANYIGEPNGEVAHELLHTSYTAKPKYVKE